MARKPEEKLILTIRFSALNLMITPFIWIRNSTSQIKGREPINPNNVVKWQAVPGRSNGRKEPEQPGQAV